MGVDWWVREREIVRPVGPPPIIRMGTFVAFRLFSWIFVRMDW